MAAVNITDTNMTAVTMEGSQVFQRRQMLDSMKAFITEQQSNLEEILQKLGLSNEELIKMKPKQICPYNSNHIVPEDKLKKHTEVCKWLHAGYQKDELESLLQDSDFWYKNCDKILKVDIDENQLNKIIWDHCVQNGQVYTGHRKLPNSAMEENACLSQEDRLAVYRHVVAKSHEAGKVIPWDRSDELLTTDWGALVKKGLLGDKSEQGFSSKLEQLAALRDLKRRRQSYRAKNVHITKKSYTEIIREVIVNQMEILTPAGTEDRQKTPAANESRKRTRSRSPLASQSEEKSHDGGRERRDGRDRAPESLRGWEDRGRERSYREREKDRGGKEIERDRRRDKSSPYREREKGSRRDRGRGSRERERYRGRDRGSRERDRNRGRSPDRERDRRSERVSQNTDRDRDKIGLSRDGDMDHLDGCSNTGDFDYNDFKTEVKHEVLSDDSESHHRDSSRAGGKDRERRKRSTSSSGECSNSSEEDNDKPRHRHKKKSKHKKKHSKKKHKRRD